MTLPSSPAASPPPSSLGTGSMDETPSFDPASSTKGSSTSNPDDSEPLEESGYARPPDSPAGPLPADWVVPTSADLAFIASLPRPEIAPAPEESSSGEPSTSSAKEETTDDQTSENDPATTSTAEPGLSQSAINDMFGAVSRQWYAATNEASLQRRDTWAVADRWIRHIRIIEGGDKQAAKESRKRPY